MHGEVLILERFLRISRCCYDCAVRDLAVLLLHVLATVARLAGPGGVRAVVAESVLVKQQLLILNRSRKRSPRLRLGDRVVAGLCALLMRPRRLVRVAIVLKPSTLLRFHRALTARKYRQLFSSTGQKKPGPKGPSQDVIAAIVDMKQRNPTWGCPRIAQQITLAFGIPMDKDVVRRILAARYTPNPTRRGRPGSRCSAMRRTACGALICFGANRPSSARDWVLQRVSRPCWIGRVSAGIDAGRERPLREPRCVPLCALSRALSHADRGVKCRSDASGSKGGSAIEPAFTSSLPG